MDKYKPYIFQAMITIIIVLIAMLVIKRNQPPTLVKIDLVAITSHYTELMTKDTMGSDSANVKKISDTVKANLEPIISSYAKEHNVVVIQAQALVDATTPDITNQVIQILDRKIK